MFSSRTTVCLGVAMSLSLSAGAVDLGSIGPTHPIREADMLQWIEQKVRAKVESGEFRRLQEEQAKRIEEGLRNPPALKSVSAATADRTSYYDPTFTVEEHIRDDKGAILVPSGTTINPLDKIALSRPLIFFDARDRRQVAFAKKFAESRKDAVLPVLVGGSYFDLMREWGRPVFYDQKAALVRRFGIKHVPAIVQQEGRRLRIDEISL